MLNKIELLLVLSPILLTIALFIIIFKLNSKIKKISQVKIIKFDLKEPYKTYLINGEKIIEGRINKGKWKEIKIGDILELDSTGEQFEVWTKREYKTFEEMLKKEGLKNVLPDKNTIKQGLEEVYYKFYKKEDEKKYGVVAIDLKKN